MILLKISNASELISAKLGNFVERLTPDAVDDSLVEDLIVRKMIDNLREEGVQGEICVVSGLNCEKNKLSLEEGLKIKSIESF